MHQSEYLETLKRIETLKLQNNSSDLKELLELNRVVWEYEKSLETTIGQTRARKAQPVEPGESFESQIHRLFGV